MIHNVEVKIDCQDTHFGAATPPILLDIPLKRAQCQLIYVLQVLILCLLRGCCSIEKRCPGFGSIIVFNSFDEIVECVSSTAETKPNVQNYFELEACWHKDELIGFGEAPNTQMWW